MKQKKCSGFIDSGIFPFVGKINGGILKIKKTHSFFKGTRIHKIEKASGEKAILFFFYFFFVICKLQMDS